MKIDRLAEPRARRVLNGLALALALLLSGCSASAERIGTPLPTVSRFKAQWRNYLRLESNKSLAIAGDRDSVYVSGYAFGLPDEQAAKTAALASCESRRQDKRIEAPCEIYAVGDRLADGTAATTAALR